MDIIRLSERAAGIAQGEVDAVPFLDHLIKVLGFASERLFQKSEKVFARWPFIVVSKLDMVPPAGGGVFYDQAEVSVAELVFINDFAVHILLAEYVQN